MAKNARGKTIYQLPNIETDFEVFYFMLFTLAKLQELGDTLQSATTFGN